MAVMRVDADAPVVVKKRLEVFAGEVLAEAMNRPVQRVNGSLYLRGLLEQGPRKSLEPMVERLGGDADYQSLQQFVADSPWDPALVVKAVAERVAGEIDVQAWVLDDTGFPKDGKGSPGVKRQYSGTLGKTGNCQIGVSVHAVGGRGTVPLGWALYLPEDWCTDEQRRRKAKIPDEVAFNTKPQLGIELVERAAGWDVPKAPVLGDHAYGENTWLRDRLHKTGCEYILSVGPTTKVFAQGAVFAVPPKKPTATRGPVRPRPDRRPEPIGELISRLGTDAAQMVTFRNDSEGEPVTSRFVFARVHAAHGWRDDQRWTGWREDSEVPPREEWLIAEWPEEHDGPTDYWISNLPADTEPERLARLAHMRWKVELDYKQLKGEEHAGNPTDPLFPTITGNHLSRDAIERRLTRHVTVAGENCPSIKTKRVTMHTLRHTAAMRLLLAGNDITLIALWLGHEQISSTNAYLHADMTHKQQAIDRGKPLTAKPGRYHAPDALMAFLENL